MTDDSRTKRATISIRTSEANKDTLARVAEENGRSLNQEIEFRLEASLLRDKDAGSRAAAILADYVRLATTIIEAQTGKRWNEDADTYFAVLQAIRSFMAQNHPPKTALMAELDDSVVELLSLDAALGEQQSLTNALLGKPADPAIVAAHAEGLERTQELLKRHAEAMERNNAAGKEASETLGHIFRLGRIESRPAPKPKAKADQAADAAVS